MDNNEASRQFNRMMGQAAEQKMLDTGGQELGRVGPHADFAAHLATSPKVIAAHDAIARISGVLTDPSYVDIGVKGLRAIDKLELLARAKQQIDPRLIYEVTKGAWEGRNLRSEAEAEWMKLTDLVSQDFGVDPQEVIDFSKMQYRTYRRAE